MKRLSLNLNKKYALIISGIIFIIFIIGAYLLVLNRAMVKGFEHDENQFVASAYLFSTDWLLPYVDYPYFHMPNLIFIYAVLFKFTAYKLMAARYFSVLSAIMTVSMIFWITFNLFKKQSLKLRLLMALCAGLLLLADPLFIYVAGRAWNHDLSILLALLATTILVLGFQRIKQNRWLFLSGVLLCLAIGVRAIWGVAILPFLLAIFLYMRSERLQKKLSLVFWFSLGGILGMFPSVILFFMAPDQFIFGNFGYAKLNTLYRQQTGYNRKMTLFSKIDFFLDFQEPGFWLLLIMTIFAIYVLGILRFRRLKKIDNTMLFGMILILFIFFGTLVPTPSWRQYFYAIVPFSIIGIMYQVAEITQEYTESIYKGWAVNLIVLMTIFSGIYGLDDFSTSLNPDRINTWFPLHIHWSAEKIATKVDSGKILTLVPMYVIEAGREIYPEFATGPFAWRTASLMPQDQREIFGLVGPDDLESYLSQQKPAGFLVGWEPDLEPQILSYIQKFGYESKREITDKLDLFFP